MMATYTGSEAITVTLVSSQVDTITLTGAGTELRISQTSTTPIYIITAQPGQTPATPTVGGAGTTAIMTDYPVVLPWTGSGIVIKVISAGTGTVNFTLTNSKFAPLGDLALKADLISPTFTGIPAAPTATAGTSTTQLATTEFVTTADQLLGTYTAYTPTWLFGVTIGNGTFSSAYATVNELTHYYGTFTFGSTSAITSATVTISLPTTPHSSITYLGFPGFNSSQVNFYDTSGFLSVYGVAAINSATGARFYVNSASGTYVGINTLSSTVPFTWTTGDLIQWNMTYRTA
jgi:hypothetical protein